MKHMQKEYKKHNQLEWNNIIKKLSKEGLIQKKLEK